MIKVKLNSKLNLKFLVYLTRLLEMSTSSNYRHLTICKHDGKRDTKIHWDIGIVKQSIKKQKHFNFSPARLLTACPTIIFDIFK